MKALQKGFTLIELMIVVAIVGILAAIALPAYQDYMARAKMTEPMAKLDELKTGIAEYVATNNAVPANGQQAGLANSGACTPVVYTGVNAVAKYYKCLGYQTTAANIVRVGVQLNNVANGSLDNAWIIMEGTIDSPNSTSVLWECYTNALSTATKFLPSNCRRAVPSAFTAM